MAGTTQYFGVTYPTSTDYVKDGAVAIEAVADGFDAALAIPTYNTQTGTSYTFVLLDAAKVVTSNNASAVTFTIPPQASVVWTTGATLTVANYGAGAVTIAGGAGVTVTNSTATISQYGSASIIRTASNAWTVIPFAGGAALLSDSAISGTTGSPTTTTYTSGGFNYKTYAFTGSGSITFSKAGLVDMLLIGAGGGGGSANWVGGGGGGFFAENLSVYAAAATHTITIGAGGAVDTNGVSTTFGAYGTLNSLVAIGGGGSSATNGQRGANGGGGSGDSGTGATTLIASFGFNGGNGGFQGGGGGGGASANGANGGGTAGGAGGAGKSSTLRTGSSVTYGGGGGSRGSGANGAGGAGGGGNYTVAGTANTGGGGGGSAAGGSGLLVVRVLA
jgi:hypothetical protein